MPDEPPENLGEEQFNPEQPGGPSLQPGQDYFSQKANQAKGKIGQKANQAASKKLISKAAGEGVADAVTAGTGGLGAVLKPLTKWVTEQIVSKLLSKDWWKLILKAYWPQILSVVLIIGIVVVAGTIIMRAYKGFWGREKVQNKSIYDHEDLANINQIIGLNPGGMIFPTGITKRPSRFGPFGSDPGAYSSNHRGIDKGIDIGTPYYAATNAKITYLMDDIPDSAKGHNQMNKEGLKQNGGFGNAIAVIVTDGRWEGYTWEIHHLQQGSATKAGMTVGKEIRMGEFIGRSGHNGYSSNPHIHFGVGFPNRGCYRVNTLLKRPCFLPRASFINPIIPLGW